MAEHSGINSPLIPKISTGFCGGLARTRGMCGAVSGAVIALGMLCGRSQPQESTDEVYIKVKQFIEAFENSYNTINCFELIGCDFNLESEQIRWKESGLALKCEEYTGTSARLVAEMVEGIDPG